MSQVFRVVTKCDSPNCDEIWTLEYPAYVGHRIPEVTQRLVTLPEGWHEYAGKTYCPRHQVTISVCVDGTAV